MANLQRRAAGRRERGLSIIGLLIVSALLIGAALVVMKCVPALTEYWNIRKIVAQMASSGDLRGTQPAAIRSAFDRRAVIDSVESITSKDLEIRRVGEGYAVHFRYERRIPLFANVSLLFDFEGGSEDRARGSASGV